MITFNELIKGNSLSDIPISAQHNLEELLKRINIVRRAWGKSMIVTSGYRSLQKHLDIYRAKGVPKEKIPMSSAHLSGQACDISDPDGSLKHWLLNEGADILEQADLYCEAGTNGWVHFQTRRPKSGNRWFAP